MPGEAVSNEAFPTPEQMAAELRDIATDLSQVLTYQQSLGVTHLAVKENTFRTITSWGTAAWKHHRFISQGPENAKIMIVDSKGSFFRNTSGQLLVKILGAMKLTPEEVFICNTADPDRIRDRVAACPPSVIIALGSGAGQVLCEPGEDAKAVLGQFHTFCGVKVMPTRHPEELLADASLKRGVWENMQQVMALAGLGHGR